MDENGQKTGSKLYLQGYHKEPSSSTSKQQIESLAPALSYDVKAFMEENKDRGLFIVKLLCFRLPDIFNRKIDPIFEFNLPGGGTHISDVYSDCRFGLCNKYFIDCVVLSKKQKFIMKCFDYEEGNLDDILLAENEIPTEEIFQKAPHVVKKGIETYELLKEFHKDEFTSYEVGL